MILIKDQKNLSNVFLNKIIIISLNFIARFRRHCNDKKSN